MSGGHGASDPIKDYVSGVIAGGVNIFVGYPFDTVKVRLQSQACHYPSSLACFRSIVSNEGIFRGLFRGLSSPLLGGAIETGVNYTVFSQSRDMYSSLPDVWAIPAAGATAGFFLSFVIGPAELIKCRLQLGAADPSHMYSGPIDCIKSVIKEEGMIRGMSRGLGYTICREMPGNAVYFSAYMGLRSLLPGRVSSNDAPIAMKDHLANIGSAVTCGGLAGMTMWATILPLDSAKTNKQTARPGSLHDVGILQQLKLLYRKGGARALYAGVTPTLIRAFPANAAQWVTWELCMQNIPALSNKNKNNDSASSGSMPPSPGPPPSPSSSVASSLPLNTGDKELIMSCPSSRY